MLSGRRVALVCAGQGSQSPGLGGFLKILDDFPVALNLVNEGKAVVGEKRMEYLLSLLESEDRTVIARTDNTQPLVFLHSCIMGSILKERGIFRMNESVEKDQQIHCVFGHSLGEYAALVLSGALKFTDGLDLVEKRGKAMQQVVETELGEFAMYAVLPITSCRGEEFADKLAETCKKASSETGKVCQIANINSDSQIVISGDKSALDLAISLGKSDEFGKYIRRKVPLQVGAPFHCSLLQPAQEILQKEVQNTVLSPFSVPFISTIKGKKESKP